MKGGEPHIFVSRVDLLLKVEFAVKGDRRATGSEAFRKSADPRGSSRGDEATDEDELIVPIVIEDALCRVRYVLARIVEETAVPVDLFPFLRLYGAVKVFRRSCACEPVRIDDALEDIAASPAKKSANGKSETPLVGFDDGYPIGVAMQRGTLREDGFDEVVWQLHEK